MVSETAAVISSKFTVNRYCDWMVTFAVSMPPVATATMLFSCRIKYEGMLTLVTVWKNESRELNENL